jgi:hypothetical protein
MYRINPRRSVAALGMSLAVAMVAAAQISVAQTPRTLPANPQNQDRVLNRQQDPQFGSRDDRQYGGQTDPRGYDGRDPRATPEAGLERRLAYLHSQLRITPMQESAWAAFTAVLRDEARDRDRIRGGAFNDRESFRGRSDSRDDRAGDARQGPPSVVERLQERRRIIAERSTDLDRILTALRPLYASFTADQRRTADRLMFQPRDERGRGGYDDNSRDPRGPSRDGRFDPRDNRDTFDYR